MTIDDSVTSVSRAIPQLTCSAAVRGSVRATAVPPEETLARLLGQGAALRVEGDGRVFAEFGVIRSGQPNFLASAANDAAHLRPLTAGLVRDRLVSGDGGLPAQLAISLSDVDLDRVVELIADSARKAHAQRVAAGHTAEASASAERADDADRAEQRAALLRQLAELDGPPATGQTGPEQQKRLFRR